MAHPIQYPIGAFAPVSRPLSTRERQAYVERIASVPLALRSALASLPADALDRPYREGGWSPRQIAHHLADAHMHGFLRTKLALVGGGGPIQGYDQAVWAEQADVLDVPVECALQLLEAVHARWARLLDGLDDDGAARTVAHPERGEITVDFMLELYGWHGDHHVGQVKAIAAAAS